MIESILAVAAIIICVLGFAVVVTMLIAAIKIMLSIK